MDATGYPIPEYVNYKTKLAAAAEDSVPSESDEFVLDSREKVWLAAVKLACLSLRPLQKELLQRKIADAADRYGIRDDIDEASDFVRRSSERSEGIRTLEDFQKAASWLERYAEHLPLDVRASLAGYLLQQSVKLGYVPSLSQEFQWNQWSGHDPYTEPLRRYAQENLHKLATGNVYRTDQFANLSLDELQECLPELLKTASLGMNAIQPDRLAKTAAGMSFRQAEVLDAILYSHGQTPVHRTCGLPLAIDDATLAAL